MSHCVSLTDDKEFCEGVFLQVKTQLGGTLPVKEDTRATKTIVQQMSLDEVEGQVLVLQGGKQVRIGGRGGGAGRGR